MTTKLVPQKTISSHCDIQTPPKDTDVMRTIIKIWLKKYGNKLRTITKRKLREKEIICVLDRGGSRIFSRGGGGGGVV